VFLRVTLPRPADEAHGQRKDDKELMAAMNAVYSLVQHYHVSSKWWETHKDEQPTFSFELVVKEGTIQFYVSAPNEDAGNNLAQIIHAQYPSAQIEPAEAAELEVAPEIDPLKPAVAGEPYSYVAGLALQKPFIFPIRTFRQLEADPIGNFANALTKVGQGMAAFQILVQPTKQDWSNQVQAALQNVQQGKSFASSDKHFLVKGAQTVAKEIGASAFGVGAQSSAQAEELKSNEAKNVVAGNVRLTAIQEQQTKLLSEKAAYVGLNTQVRVIATGTSQVDAQHQAQAMITAFTQLFSPDSNGFKVVAANERKLIPSYHSRTFSKLQSTYILNTEELTTLFHFPNVKIETPNIKWLGSRRLPPPMNLPESGVLIGKSTFRSGNQPIYLPYKDRMRHMYMLGKSGSGKTNLFQNMIVQDIRNGAGVCYIDPNGDAIE